MKRLFILLGMLCAITTVFSQNISKAEYFVDVDPGQGNGVPIANFAAGDTVNFSISIPTATLTSGFHFLGVRVANVDGKWSRYESRGFYLSSTTAINTADIVSAEFFIDSDPGPGTGWPVTLSTTGPVINFTAISPVPLSPGFHFIAIRVKNGDGKWSLFEQRGFYVMPFPANMPPLVAAEYFYDTDPGVGNGFPLDLAITGDSINQSFLVSVPAGLSAGDHYVGFRVKDQSGNWSFFAKDTITVGIATTISCPGNVTVTAAAGQCTAMVNNIDATVTPVGSAYTYTLSGATTGTGSGTASGHVFNPGVTTVTYALSSTPTTSCSFTVTVNPNATASVTIEASQTTICSGQPVTFTATTTNGGTDPTYEWTLNNSVVGADTNVYQSSTLHNGDVIRVTMQPYGSCAGNAPVYSNSITMTVNSGITPSVSITASAIDICSGTPVTFTATPINGGTPAYQWKLNGSDVGSNSATYQTSSLANADTVKVVMTSSMSCATSPTATSNSISMDVSQSVIPSVSIVASSTAICNGQLVTFTATPTNGGSNPYYQWRVNGNSVSTAGPTYQSSSLQNGDSVEVFLTSTLPCADPYFALSNSIHITVAQPVTPSVSIAASATSICSGQQVNFTATPVNGGSNPSYQWKKNGFNVGLNSNIYQTTALANGDVITVVMTPSVCASPTFATSNTITMVVGSGLTPSVTISASAIDICAGTEVTFTANPTNGGSNPHYQWKLNGNNVGDDSEYYHSSTLAQDDTIRVIMTSSLSCTTTPTAVSNYISMDVSAPVTPSVIISASSTVVCSGTSVTFTATATNGGSPAYQWKVNGNIVGGNSDTYQGSALQDDDTVSVVMTSSLGCASPQTVTSNNVVMIVGSEQTCYRDLDGDGYGSASSGTIQTCYDMAGYVTNNYDCDDNNAAIHPEATEICGNGIDDDCNGIIDDNCNTDLPVLGLKTYPVKEGDAGYTLLNVEVKLDRPASLPVRLNYATSNDDAIAGSDYVATNGILTIPVGASSGTVQVKIIGDVVKESNEKFWLNFSNPENVVIDGDPRSRIMIIDDDKRNPNHTAANTGQSPIKEESWKIPTVIRRNQVWVIPQIGNYPNEVLIINAQGQLVNRFVNYQNQTAIGNVATGLYFYRIRITEKDSMPRILSGRLLITE